MTSLTEQSLASVRAHLARGPKDMQLLQHVVGEGGDVQGYFYGGFTASIGVRALVQHLGREIGSFRRVLDFGCGSARVLAWFRDIANRVELHGCDINTDAIAWSKANAPYARFVNNGAAPPLPYTDGFFDLVYGLSVFTHLDEDLQRAWLQEIHRISAPGALVLLSVHGTHSSQQDLTGEELAKFRRTGFLYQGAKETATVAGLPSFYQVAFHSEEYIEREWGGLFEVLGYASHGCAYNQKVVILRRKDNSWAIGSKPVRLDLPMAVLENPTFGKVAEDETVTAWGWAFYPDSSRPVDVQLLLDGYHVNETRTWAPRPDVGRAFFTSPGAASGGFSMTFSTKGLHKGWHVLLLTSKESQHPLCATCFRIETPLWRRALAKRIYDFRVKVRIRTRLRALRKRKVQ